MERHRQRLRRHELVEGGPPALAASRPAGATPLAAGGDLGGCQGAAAIAAADQAQAVRVLPSHSAWRCDPSVWA